SAFANRLLAQPFVRTRREHYQWQTREAFENEIQRRQASRLRQSEVKQRKTASSVRKNLPCFIERCHPRHDRLRLKRSARDRRKQQSVVVIVLHQDKR